MPYIIELIDFSDYNWNIDVYYKNQYISSLNRKEFRELFGMFALSTWIFDRKYHQTFHPDSCELTNPFEVNCHMYADQKLASLNILLNNQHDANLESWMKSTLAREKEQYEILKKASDEHEFNQYFNSLNEENTLKFVLKKLNIEKKIDLKFIKNIDLIYDEYIDQLNQRKKRVPELYEDSNSHANLSYNFTIEFREKYESMMKKIDEIGKI